MNLELNLDRNVRVTVGGGFRLAIAGSSEAPLSSSDLRGFIARTAIEFGEF